MTEYCVFNNKYNACVYCDTFEKAIDIYEFLMHKKYHVCLPHSQESISHLLQLNRLAIIMDNHVVFNGYESKEAVQKWCNSLVEKPIDGISKHMVNCIDNIDIFKAIASITDDTDIDQIFIIDDEYPNDGLKIGDAVKCISNKNIECIEQNCISKFLDKEQYKKHKASQIEIINYFNNRR